MDFTLNSCSVSSLVSAHIHRLSIWLSPYGVTNILLLLGLPCSPMAKTYFISPFLSPTLPPSLYTQEHASTHEHTTHTHVYLCICTRVHTHTHQCFRCSVSINENGLPFELFVCLNCCLHILPSGSPLFQNSFVSDISKMSTGYQLYVAEPLTENTHIHRGIPRIFAKLPSPGHRVRTSAVSQNSIILSLLCTEPCRAQELFCEGDLISCQGCPRL